MQSLRKRQRMALMGGRKRGRRWSTVGTLLALFALAMLLMTASAGASSGSTVWLCKPVGPKTPNPCLEDRTATVVTYTGDERHETVQSPVKGSQSVDCFYVYPTVSEQEGPNANLEIEPQETQIAIDQASRFSQVCKVWAPMYPQLTLKWLLGGKEITQEDRLKAYLGVLGAFREYLQKYNKGRGIVLIGHSQGAGVLESLIQQEFDENPALRKQLVSAILLGGNVLVPEGQLEGATFQHVPLCTSATETACVIAYSTFLKEPPAFTLFGRSPVPGTEVACVNPTLAEQNGGTGSLLAYSPTTPFPGVIGPGVPTPTASTPWVLTEGIYQAQCKHEHGATWLQAEFNPSVTPAARADLKAHNEEPQELIGAEWGLHLYDVDIALGNLTNTVASEIHTYKTRP
jgi:Protein of unknown function (DUF3089)